MVIAIDLNDVIRDMSKNFMKLYKERVNRKFDIENFEMTSPDLDREFNFLTPKDYERFTYEVNAYDIFAKCPTTSVKLTDYFNRWCQGYVADIDTKEEIELVIISTKEFGLSIPNTLLFLSKLGLKCRNYYFPIDSFQIWDKCDILITANPYLIDRKPENKLAVKIETTYNTESEADFTYANAEDFFRYENNIREIVEKYESECK